MTPQMIASLTDDKLISSTLMWYAEHYIHHSDKHPAEGLALLIDELMKRLFVSQLSVGLIMAMYHKVNHFSEFTEEGFKSADELVGEYQYAVEQNGDIIRKIYSGELSVYECMRLLHTQNINKNGKVTDSNDDEQ
jgi:hypothetical protein